jgi:hypothetical protein
MIASGPSDTMEMTSTELAAPVSRQWGKKSKAMAIHAASSPVRLPQTSPVFMLSEVSITNAVLE